MYGSTFYIAKQCLTLLCIIDRQPRHHMSVPIKRATISHIIRIGIGRLSNRRPVFPRQVNIRRQFCTQTRCTLFRTAIDLCSKPYELIGVPDLIWIGCCTASRRFFRADICRLNHSLVFRYRDRDGFTSSGGCRSACRIGYQNAVIYRAHFPGLRGVFRLGSVFDICKVLSVLAALPLIGQRAAVGSRSLRFQRLCRITCCILIRLDGELCQNRLCRTAGFHCCSLALLHTILCCRSRLRSEGPGRRQRRRHHQKHHYNT